MFPHARTYAAHVPASQDGSAGTRHDHDAEDASVCPLRRRCPDARWIRGRRLVHAVYCHWRLRLRRGYVNSIDACFSFCDCLRLLVSSRSGLVTVVFLGMWCVHVCIILVCMYLCMSAGSEVKTYLETLSSVFARLLSPWLLPMQNLVQNWAQAVQETVDIKQCQPERLQLTRSDDLFKAVTRKCGYYAILISFHSDWRLFDLPAQHRKSAFSLTITRHYYYGALHKVPHLIWYGPYSSKAAS